ncbi:hypothetical protein ABZ345_06645 [Lentzea sp. NPDC005914]|uniref:hypothetical protein n=1 Tax=Lentzea sp. NPDC005914 TaxID=3154572 RepID=UPI0033DCFFFA
MHSHATNHETTDAARPHEHGSAHRCATDILALQKLAGNAAVSDAVTGTTAPSHRPGSPAASVQRQQSGSKAPVLRISGAFAAGEPLTPVMIVKINEAALQVPKQFRRFVAYETFVKVGGSLAWRANNPGNLRAAPTAIAKVPGASGTFAVFATMEDGRAAQRDLYVTTYGSRTVRKAIAKLTPPSENDTALYLKKLEKAGVDLDATVSSQIDELMAAVEVNEGMIEGILVVRAPKSFAPD